MTPTTSPTTAPTTTPYRATPSGGPSSPPGPGRALPRPPISKAAYWTGYVVVFVVPLLAAGFLAFDEVENLRPMWPAALAAAWGLGGPLALRLWAQAAGGSLAKANALAVRLLGEGEPAKAAAILESILDKSYLFPVAYTLYLWNRGVAATRLGRFADARTMIRAVHGVGWFERRRFRHFVAPVMLSAGMVEALAGDVDAAAGWARGAHAKLLSSSGAAALPLDVMLAARRQQMDEAEALCAAHWASAEAVLTARDMKLLRVLRAFVASRRNVADRTELDQWLAGIRPVAPGMFSYLGTQWQEMAAFLRAELGS
jgi:hypothetical protein